MCDTYKGKKILIIGSSSDLASGLVELFAREGAFLGLHYNNNYNSLNKYAEKENTLIIKRDLSAGLDCNELVEEYVSWAKGIDYLIIASGNISGIEHWESICRNDFLNDLNVNFINPFFIAREAVKHMKENGGKIIFTGTASAKRGGGSTSIAYGASKYSLECVTKRMAKDCAKYNILVNLIAPGFVMTRFNTERKPLTNEQLKERIEFIPLKRPGNIEDITKAALFLLSSDNVTGEILNIDGGDFI